MVTFDRHPATVVRPESAPRLLCDLDQKLELLEAAGVDRTVVVRFDTERANETAEEFVNGILVEGLDARLVVVGEDFHFGHGRKGNVALLRGDGVRLRIRGRRRLAPGRSEAPWGLGEPISSTRMRSLVAPGRVEEAAALLGRPHQVRGPVVHGDQRGGSELGFPDRQCRRAGRDLPAGHRHLRRAGTSVRTGRSGRRPSRSAADRPSTGATASCWSRPTCSTSPTTSTARRPGCRSSPDCATSWPSTPPSR